MNNRFLLTCTALSVILMGCSSPPPPQFGAMPVKLGEVQSAQIEDTSSYMATLKSRGFATLRPDVEGQITGIYVKAGDHVRQGQLLIQIRPDEQQAMASSANASSQASLSQIQTAADQLKSLEAQKPSLLSELERSQKDYDRYAALFAQNAVSQSEMDHYTDTLKKAKASVDSLQSQIQAQKSAVQQVGQNARASQSLASAQQARLAYYRITAPFSGIVGDIPVKKGDYVVRSNVLTTLTQGQAPMDINIAIPKEKKGLIGRQTQIQLLDSQQKIVGETNVAFVEPAVDSTTQTVMIKGRLASPASNVITEESLQARIIWSSHTGLTVPVTSVLKSNGQDFVFIPQQNKGMLVAKQLPVQLGRIQGDVYEVKSGLKAGDRIVISGIQTLFEGAPIQPAAPPQTAQDKAKSEQSLSATQKP